MFGIFWDCDGTIMDTEKSYAYAWKDFLLSKGLDLPIEDFDKFVGVYKLGLGKEKIKSEYNVKNNEGFDKLN